MPFYTPRGLKIRLDQQALETMLDESGVLIDLDDAFADIELWARLPGAMGAVNAIVAAASTHSAAWTLAASFAAFTLGYILQQCYYSPFLRIIFPQFLGSWLIAIPTSIICSAYLYWSGNAAVAIVVLAIVLCTSTGIADFLLFLLLPVRVLLIQMRVVLPMGDMEQAFISILDLHASKQNAQLDWSIYDREWRSRLG
jgi:hypothetical protein